MLAGCQRGSAPAPEPSGGAPLKKVKLVSPSRDTVRHAIEQPGYNVEALHYAPLYARVPGYVGALHVDIGAPVKKGQVLIEQEVPELAADLAQRQALVLQAGAEGKQAEKALGAAEASLKSAAAQVKQAEAGRLRVKAEHARAKMTSERLTAAGATGTIDKESVAEAKLGLDAASAGLQEVEAKVQSYQAMRDESEARRDKATADVEVAAARVDVAKAERDRAREMLAYGKIKAPFDGIVTARNIDVGHFAQPASSGKGEALLVVQKSDTVRVFFNVPAHDAIWVKQPLPGKRGLPARVRGQGLGGRVFHGHVTRTASALDPRTRTLRTEIDLPNPDGELTPGTYVYASLVVEHAGVWTLPASAVVLENGEAFCFRFEGGKAMRTRLLVGLSGGGLIEVSKIQTKSGSDGWVALDGKEEIIANAAGLTDGEAVAR